MTVVQVERKGEIVTRAGTYALSLLAIPLNVSVLETLAEEPRSLVDLRRAAGSPPQTTMRGHLRTLTELGILEKRRRNDFPGSLDFELRSPGRELLLVAEVVRTWLAAAPDGSLQLGSTAAKSAIKALVDGWQARMLRALAARPLSLTDLDRVIASLTYPSLERRLAAMRLAGQVEAALPNGGRGTPYAVTDWLRQAIAPLGAAARWERQIEMPDSAPIGPRDAETAFLLVVPLLRLDPDLSGSCRLAVEMDESENNGHRLVGVMVEVEAGRVVSCTSRLEGKPSAWTVGSAPVWLAAIIEHDADRLELGGDCHLANGLLEGLHGALFADRT